VSSPFFATARPTARMCTGAAAASPRRAARAGAGGKRSMSMPWYTSATLCAAAGAWRVSSAWPARVHVTHQRQSASFSDSSQAGVVQMSFACAEIANGSPAIRAA
jgi:hypothetical protein